MSEITIRTNNVPRDLLFYHELSQIQQEQIVKERDWLDDEERLEESYFIYKGEVHALSDFEDLHNQIHHPNPPDEFKDWDGILTQTYFSGMLIKYARTDWNPNEWDTERIIVGQYFGG